LKSDLQILIVVINTIKYKNVVFKIFSRIYSQYGIHV
jgi:hypothetical protein